MNEDPPEPISTTPLTRADLPELVEAVAVTMMTKPRMSQSARVK